MEEFFSFESMKYLKEVKPINFGVESNLKVSSGLFLGMV
jgi:hypothetical protein